MTPPKKPPKPVVKRFLNPAVAGALWVLCVGFQFWLLGLGLRVQGLFETLCCMWPGNAQTQAAYNAAA